MSVRLVLQIINGIAIAAVLTYVVVTLRATPVSRGPQNLTPFLSDEDLEGRRLERALGWALICSAVVAVSLPLYWLREPTRQEQSIVYFNDGAVERGAVLFANKQSEHYSNVNSLLCADCHGVDGGGGAASTNYTAPGRTTPIRVTWAAPALNTVLLRFTEEEVTNVITYGRPGTPMQAWGVAGGGPKMEQSVGDLVAYIKSIQITPEEAQAKAAADLAAERDQPEKQLDDAKAKAKEAKAAVEEAEAALDDLNANADTPPAEITAAQATLASAEDALAEAESGLAWAEDWFARRDGVTDGQILYELNCARCHTASWSIFDPETNTPDDIDLGLAGGGGTQGFNLRDGGTLSRFGPGTAAGSDGFASHADFITNGSENNKPYGVSGIGSGRMPGFGEMLTDEQITAIVEYERTMLDRNDPSTPED